MGADVQALARRVRAAVMSVPRLDWRRHPLEISCEAGAVTIEGEVGDVAVKRLVLAQVRRVPGVREVVDWVRVMPAERMGDGAISNHVRDALLQEAVFGECAIRAWGKGHLEAVREPREPKGELVLSVEEGVVSLRGEAPSLSHQRLAGVLAWWVPGSRDVVNELTVSPPQTDSDDEVTDALQLALENDPFVDATQVRVHTRDRVVTLEGLVPSDAQREMAEFDAWYVLGVEGVENRLEVRP